MIKAEIVADSLNTHGQRITTMLVTFPRFILAELNTHRMLSKNSASSRAIPFDKMLSAVLNNGFKPIAWQLDHKGMQGSTYADETLSEILYSQWEEAKKDAIIRAKALSLSNATKQLCNRLLEPFMWHTVLITATEWENLFHLRCPQYELFAGPENTEEYRCHGRSWKDFMKSNNGLAGDWKTDNIVERLKLNKGQAEIHMMALAEAMWDTYNESTPMLLKAGEWHIPFEDKIDTNQIDLNMADAGFDFTLSKVKIATAMCARVSYTVVGEEDKVPNYENDIKLHDRLSKSGHWSPFEHCARVMTQKEYYTSLRGTYKNGIGVEKDFNGWCGNFRGFIQYRKMFDNENVTLK